MFDGDRGDVPDTMAFMVAPSTELQRSTGPQLSPASVSRLKRRGDDVYDRRSDGSCPRGLLCRTTLRRGHRCRAVLGRWVLLFVATAAVACGAPGPVWQEATSASGDYVAEFPGKPTTRTQPLPSSDLSMLMTEVDMGCCSYGLAEMQLPGDTPCALDGAVDGAVEKARAGLESSSGKTVTASELSRSTGEFEGVETRRLSAELLGGDQKTTMSYLVFCRDDVLVQAVVASNGPEDARSVDRFLSSLKPRNG